MRPIHRHAISSCATLVTAVCAIELAVPASAQWTVVKLHPDGAHDSEARSIFAAQQMGVTNANGATGAAVLWNGSAPSGRALNPVVPGQASAGITADGRANSVTGQGGWINVTSPAQGVGTFTHATIWSGSAQSWINLHPSDPAVLHSGVYAMSDTTQGGYFYVDAGGGTFSTGAPCLWHGTAASFVDLTPAGYSTGAVAGVSADQQVGATYDAGLGWACLWNGTADSFVNLNPDPTLFSAATCTDGTHQFGVNAIIAETYSGLYPVQWTGTPESWIEMGVDDPTTRWGEVHATHGGWQVGYTTDTDGASNDRACYWTGAPGTFTDLNQYLPAPYIGSNALGIWRHVASGTTYIVGYADNGVSGQHEAVMWVNGSGVNLIVSPVAPADCSSAAGDSITYAIRVLNAGPTTSGAVTLTVDLPAAGVATYSSATPPPATLTPTQAIFNLSSVPASGGFIDISLTLTAVAAGATASITATATTAGEADPTNNVASASTRIQPAAPAIAAARALLSTNTAAANSVVPGGGGARFTALSRPFASPSGNWWIEGASTNQATAQNQLLTRTQTGGATGVLVQKGITTTSHGALGVFDVGAEVNDGGLVAFAGIDSGSSTTNRFIATTSGGPLNEIARKGGAIPAMAGINYSSNVGASANLFNSGQVGFSTDSSPSGSNAYLSNNGSAIIARVNVTTPSGASNVINSVITSNTDGGTHGGINFDATGAHQIYQATIATGNNSTDMVVVADGAVIMQEGVTVLPGMAAAVDGVNKDITMGPAGDWLVHGKNADGQNWVARGSGSTLTQVIRNGDPIYAGASETWQPDLTAPLALTFFAQVADSAGNYVVGGTTSNASTFANSVLVYNNQVVIARENDPVDLDGNGLFDDGVYIRSFDTASVTFVSGAVLAVVTLRDDAAALCNLEDVSQGQALIRIPLPCPADLNGDRVVDLGDLAILLSNYGLSPAVHSQGDVNNDGTINLSDLALLLSAYGSSCL